MAGSTHDSAWGDLLASVAHLHPNAPAAVRRAVDFGVDPRTYSGALLTGPRGDHLPALLFGDWSGDRSTYTMVMPHEAHVVRRFH